MAKKDQNQATETLEEIEGGFDRLAEWVQSNPTTVLTAIALVLTVALGVNVQQCVVAEAAEESSARVAQLQGDYREAMGAVPGAIEVPEPANPETARAVREDYLAQFLAVGDEFDGSTAAVEARVLAGTLQEQLGDPTAAIATWRLAAENAPSGTTLQALAYLRLARGLESQSEPAAAAEAFETAGRIEAYGARYSALAEAARCFAEAGDTAQALPLVDEALAQDAAIPAYLSARLRELRARHADPAAAEQG